MINTATASNNGASPTAEALGEALRASEARFHQLIEKSADGVVVVCDDGTICYVNPAATQLLGRSASDLLDQPFGRLVVPGATTEIDIPRGDGTLRIAELRAVMIDWEGRPASLATLRDVTERKQVVEAQRFLAEASSALANSLDLPTTLASVARIAMSHLADGCLIDLIGRDQQLQRVVVAHRVPEVEARAHPLKGCAPLDLGGTKGLRQVLRTGRSKVFSEVPDVILGTLVPNLEQLLVIRTLGIRSVMIVPLLVRGRTLGAITLFNTPPSRRLEPSNLPLAEELASRAALAIDNARLYDESQEAVRARDEFLAMLAHELRNPLAPILNAASILRFQQPGNPNALRPIEVIERQARQMARLLDDLLDISRVTRGTIQLGRETIDFRESVTNAIQTSTPLIESRGHHLATCLPDQPVWLDADPTRIEQVIVNLLNNAARYTPPGGGIQLSITTEGGHAVARVADSGFGMTPEMITRVFDLFVQGDRTLDRSQSGLGIGLTLVKNLVEMHGGSVSASSPGPDQGSEFVIHLPLAVLPVPGTVEANHAPGRSTLAKRVLIVEDIKDNRDMLRELLTIWGHHVETAEDGLKGLEAIRQLQPDIALIDIGLPGMDGYQLAQRVRALPDLGRTTLVALTGYAQPDDRRRVHASGFDAHLVKPVNLEELSRILLQSSD